MTEIKTIKKLTDIVEEQKAIDILDKKDTTERDNILNLLNEMHQEELLSL